MKQWLRRKSAERGHADHSIAEITYNSNLSAMRSSLLMQWNRYYNPSSCSCKARWGIMACFVVAWIRNLKDVIHPRFKCIGIALSRIFAMKRWFTAARWKPARTGRPRKFCSWYFRWLSSLSKNDSCLPLAASKSSWFSTLFGTREIAKGRQLTGWGAQTVQKQWAAREMGFIRPFMVHSRYIWHRHSLLLDSTWAA